MYSTDIKHGESWRQSLTEAGRRLRDKLAAAVSRIKPGAEAKRMGKSGFPDVFRQPRAHDSIMGADLYEDDKKLVIRIEIPGMDKEDLNLEVHDNVLWVTGEKRKERRGTHGRYHYVQCAYGRSTRKIALPVPVVADKAYARYRDGVLSVELPKAKQSPPQQYRITVQ